MTDRIFTHQLDNGLTLVAESMPWLESAAVNFALPAGCAFDPPDRRGLASLAAEMALRGCGDRDARRFISDLERLGVHHSSNVGSQHTSFGGAMPAENLLAALVIFADLVRRPLLPEKQLEEGRMVCLQELRGLEDDFAQQVLIELRRRQYGSPWGEPHHGERESLSAMTMDDVRRFVAERFGPRGAIVSVAGKFDWPQVRDHVERLMVDWKSANVAGLVEEPGDRSYKHIAEESHQTHVGIGYETVPYRDENFYVARASVGVLSDGMSSRLFYEVREKRGLCYSVFASQHSLKDRAAVLSYCGTSPQQAQETIDVMTTELVRLGDGVGEDELDRLKVRLKSTLVMQQESSSSRCSSIAGDWYHLGRVRSLDEVQDIIGSLTAAKINEYLAAHPPRDFAYVTLGPQPLEIPRAVS